MISTLLQKNKLKAETSILARTKGEKNIGKIIAAIYRAKFANTYRLR